MSIKPTCLNPCSRSEFSCSTARWGRRFRHLGLDESAVRGERFAGHHKDLKNFADILCLTHPKAIEEIHRRYFAAGADIVETNTFGASPLGMEEFDLPLDLVREINFAAVSLACQARDEFNERTPDRPRFVAGSIGPTTKQTAISTKVDDASYRGVTFDEMVDSYYAQVAAMVEAGVDILMPETVIDTLNLKACLFAIQKYFAEKQVRMPVMLSGTFDRGGATFVSGQDVEAFWNAIAHFPMLSVGMNCALGPDMMRPHIERLQRSFACVHQLPSERRAAERDGAVTTSARPTWASCWASLPSRAG